MSWIVGFRYIYLYESHPENLNSLSKPEFLVFHRSTQPTVIYKFYYQPMLTTDNSGRGVRGKSARMPSISHRTVVQVPHVDSIHRVA